MVIPMNGLLPSLLALALAAATTARAISLDWSAVTWTPGSLVNSYDIDPGNPGNDITITVSGNTSRLGDDSQTGNPTPDISTFKEGGQADPVQPSLAFLVDYTSRSQAITVTVDFNYQNGVNAASFLIFDIDVGSSTGSGHYTYVDQIRNMWGTRLDGSTIGATTLTNGPSVTLAGSGTSRTATGNASVPDSGSGSGDGNLYISFGTNVVDRIQFTYGSGSNAQSDPAAQAISFFTAAYTGRPVPEVGTTLGAAGVGLAALATLLLRRRQTAAARR